MYSITIIRLNWLNNQFQNTEVQKVCSGRNIETYLSEYGATFEQIEEFLNLSVGNTTTIQINNEDINKMWFIYIGRFK